MTSVSRLGASGDSLKNLPREKHTFNVRIGIAVALCLLMSGLLTVRLFELQWVKYDYYRARADDNRMRLTPIAPVRGLIYDRNGALLAQNLPAFVLDITPEKVPDLNDTLARLTKLINLTDTEISRFRERVRRGPRYRAVTLRSNLTPEEVARYELNRFDFQGVDVNASLVRSYPLGEAASHVIGYVGGISDSDYTTIAEADYLGLTQIGKSGIERSHENELRGAPGTRIIEANAAGRPLRELESRPGTSGQNLYLSLDAQLQTVAEKALGDLNGAVVAIDPRTGEVLTLVSKPGFDPAQFAEGIDGTSYRALLQDPNRPLYNRALLGTYPPGSTIKPFIAVAGLMAGTLTPETRVYDPGYFQLPNVERKYRCYKREGHGTVDLNLALQKSCDVYFYQAAINMGIDQIDAVLGAFGIGRLTNIDIPHEKSGILPSREWKRRVYRQAWFPGETVNTGIGQGYLTLTPLQLAQATAVLAMRGVGYKPHMIHALRTPGSDTLVPFEPEPLPVVEARDHNVFERTIAAMQLVTQTPGGTAYAVFKDAPYTVAGKTGTAQVAGLAQDELVAKKLEATPLLLRDHALFMAFAPVDAPRIAVAIVAEHAGHGGSAAAPVARQIMDQYLLGHVLYNHTAGAPPALGNTEPDDDTDAVPPDAGPGAVETPTTNPVPPQ